METIWRYPIEITGVQEITMPSGAEILCVKNCECGLCIWAIVSWTGEEGYTMEQTRTIRIYGTGEGKIRGQYLDTVQRNEFVWHVFLGG